MSVAEILAELPRLTPPEREEIASRLATMRRVQDPAFLEEMDRRIDRMEAGEFTSGERLHEILREHRERK